MNIVPGVSFLGPSIVGQIKSRWQNRVLSAIMKNLSGFQVGSHGFQDLFPIWVQKKGFLSLRHFFWTLNLFSALFAIKVVIVLVLSLLSGALTDAIRDVLINLSN